MNRRGKSAKANETLDAEFPELKAQRVGGNELLITQEDDTVPRHKDGLRWCEAFLEKSDLRYIRMSIDTGADATWGMNRTYYMGCGIVILDQRDHTAPCDAQPGSPVQRIAITEEALEGLEQMLA